MNIENRSLGRAAAATDQLVRPATAAHRLDLLRLLPPICLSLTLLVGAVLFMVASYPLWPRLYLSPALDLTPELADLFLALFSSDLAHHAVNVTGGNVFFLMYLAATAVFFGVYSLAMLYARRVRPRAVHLVWLLASTAFVGALLLFAPTLFTSDLYSYVIYGRIGAAYGGNPYVTPPNEFSFDPVYPLLFWKDTLSVYGPVWTGISHLLMAAVPPAVGQQVVAFKALAILFHLANAALVWRILERLAPHLRLPGTVAYIWNPLLLIEFASNGHNDVVMVFFLLLAVLSIIDGRRIQPLVFLTSAILTKWVAFFLLPIYLVAVAREHARWRERALFLLSGGSVMAIVAVLLYWPYWSGPATFSALLDSASVERFINSVPELLVKPFSQLLRDRLPSSIATTITDKTAGYLLKAALGAIFLVFWLREAWLCRSVTAVAAAWLRTLFAYLVIATTWFWPWYISWLVPFAAISGRTRLTRATLLFTLGGVFFYSTWPGAPLRPFEPYYDARAIALFGLPLLYLVGAALVDRWRAVHSKAEAPE